MFSKSLQCPACFNSYSLTERLPRFLSQCGHTVCNLCLVDLLKKDDTKCPIDDQPFQADAIFPINIALKELVEDSETQNNSYAPQDQKSGETSFQLKEDVECEKDVESVVAESPIAITDHKMVFEMALENMTEQQKELDGLLEERRTDLNKALDEKFEELATLLKMKKLGLSLILESFFKKEKQRLNLIIGKDSKLYSYLVEKLNGFKDSARDDRLLGTIEEELEQFAAKLNNIVLKKQVKDFKQKLDEISDSITEVLVPQTDLANTLGIENEDFTDKLESIYPNNKEEVNSGTGSNSQCMKFETSLEFETCDGYLKITATGKPPKMTLINTDEWKDMAEVRLKIDKFTFAEEDMKVLSCLWNDLEHTHCIKIDASFQNILPEDQFLNLFTIIFSKPHLLQDIELNLEETQIGEEGPVYLMENVLPKVLTLKSLNFNFINSGLTDLTIQAFTKRSLPYITNLENFSFYIRHSSGTEDSLVDMFVKFPTVKNFELGLSCTELGDTGLKAFANVTLPSMVALENLTFRAWKTKITDEGVKELFMNLPDVKTFILDLGSNMITDHGVEELTSAKLPSMKNLESFELRLYDTEVTEQTVAQIYQIKKNLSN